MPAPQPDVSPAANRGNLFDNIGIQHGPVDGIRRFLRLGEQEALRRGISLSFGTFDELLAVNEQNRDSWRPLVGVFDPRLNMLEPSSSYCILGRNGLGEVVSTQAARLYDWRHTNFHDAATSLRFIYKSPDQDKRPGEVITITAKEAQGLGGRVVFSGAGWYRRDHRNTGLSTVLPRVSRACTLTLWDPDYVMTLMAEPVFRGGFAQRGGFTHSSSSVRWTNSVLGDVDLLLVWMTGEEAYADLAAASESLISRDRRQSLVRLRPNASETRKGQRQEQAADHRHGQKSRPDKLYARTPIEDGSNATKCVEGDACMTVRSIGGMLAGGVLDPDSIFSGRAIGM